MKWKKGGLSDEQYLLVVRRRERPKEEKDLRRMVRREDDRKSLSSCRFATHIGKYTDPTVKAILLDKKANTDKEGRFVATSTADCQPDVF